MACSRGKAHPDTTTKLKLFSSSAGRCQKPDCLQPLFLDLENRSIHFAEMAHVFAATDGGARTDAALTEAERGLFENLILLCPTCHTVIDKAEDDFPAHLMKKWKSDHQARLDQTFGAAKFESRRDARQFVEPLFYENKEIFLSVGPNNEYKANPESELADRWQGLVLSAIVPNNRMILRIVNANWHLLREDEKEAAIRFRVHVRDLEERHLLGEFKAGGATFPTEINNVFEG